MVPNAVEKEVVTLPTFGEILLRVINDPICADGSDHVHVPRTAYAGHLCAERLGDLHSEGTHASRRTVNQDLLPRLNVSLVAKTLQCGECRHRCRSCLFKRHAIRLHDQCRLGSTHILGKGPLADPDFNTRSLRVSDTQTEHCVAWFELRYVPANRFDLAGHINAQSCDLWFAQAGHYASDVRRASHEVPVKWIDGSRANLDQDFVVLGNGLFDIRDLDNDIRGAVS